MNSYGQELSSDFRTVPVNKKIKEFPDQFDLSTPLKSCITFNYLLVNGKECFLRIASTEKNKYSFPDSNAPDSKVTEEARNKYLNMNIKEVIIYKDSVASVISEFKESRYSIRGFNLENGKWVNAGENQRSTMAESRQYFAKYAGQQLCTLRKIKIFSTIPQDSLSFIHFLKKNGQKPKEFVLDALTKHKIVIYGELHRRLLSWSLCRTIIKDPAFRKSTGTIFLEISSHKQKELDAFFAKDKMDKELILNVFRETAEEGWHDKGMFDFILEVWKVNQTLPSEKRIKVVAVDIPRPFSTFKSAEDCNNYFDTVMDRNVFMANSVEKYIKLKKDNRNCLFIVGAGHVYKSAESAGSLLSKKYPAGELFTIFTHCPIIDNIGHIYGRIRNGIFDYSFYMTGNKPIAFNLKNSPFGKEPFDGLPEISYDCNTGSFSDNYDGYIFLGSLDTEPYGEMLYELYTDEFIKELIRRANFDKMTLQEWFEIKEANKEAVIESLKETEGKNRWGILPSLFDKRKSNMKKK